MNIEVNTCPFKYNRNRKKHKHLTYQERLTTERWINKDNKAIQKMVQQALLIIFMVYMICQVVHGKM